VTDARVRGRGIVAGFRWWLFKRLSAIGWAVCPEPDRTILRGMFSTQWDEVEASQPKGDA
jgi:hypothetical protein